MSAGYFTSGEVSLDSIGSNSFISHQMGELTAEAERQYQMRMDAEKELQELKQQKSTGPDSGVPELQIANVCIERLVAFWPLLHLPDFFLLWSFPAFGKIAISPPSSVVCVMSRKMQETELELSFTQKLLASLRAECEQKNAEVCNFRRLDFFPIFSQLDDM